MKYIRYNCNYSVPNAFGLSDFIDYYSKGSASVKDMVELDMDSEDASDSAVFAELFPAKEDLTK